MNYNVYGHGGFGRPFGNGIGAEVSARAPLPPVVLTEIRYPLNGDVLAGRFLLAVPLATLKARALDLLKLREDHEAQYTLVGIKRRAEAPASLDRPGTLLYLCEPDIERVPLDQLATLQDALPLLLPDPEADLERTVVRLLLVRSRTWLLNLPDASTIIVDPVQEIFSQVRAPWSPLVPSET